MCTGSSTIYSALSTVFLRLNYFVLGMSRTRERSCSVLNLKHSRGGAGTHYSSAFAGLETLSLMLPHLWPFTFFYGSLQTLEKHVGGGGGGG